MEKEFSVGDKVVVTVPKGLNPLGRVEAGSVGKVVVAEPGDDYYEVAFSDNRVYIFPNRQMRLATKEDAQN